MEPDDRKSWRQFQRLKPDRKQLSKRARRLELVTVRHAHKFLIKRWENVQSVRRHMLSWLLLVGLLITATGMQMMWNQQSYMVDAAVPGGTYAEGVLGNLDNLNPIYATSSAERSASRLIFAPLLSYDRDGRLRGDLAESWRVNNEGREVIVTLRDGLTWHDGQPFTSEDVVFTVDRIKDVEARSPYYTSWQSIRVAASDDRTVTFTLPAVYAPFPHALTIGMLPKHLLEDVAPAALRENQFSTNPIGTGPFQFRNIQNIDVTQGRKVVHMAAFDNYLRGKPKLERFQLHTYGDVDQLKRALETSEVSAVSDLTASAAEDLSKRSLKVEDIPMNNGVYALFRNNSDALKDVEVRRAIRLGTDVQQVRAVLDNRVDPLEGPLFSSQVSGQLTRMPSFNEERANRALDAAGWRRNGEGVRQKDNTELSLSVVALQTGDYPVVVEELARQWRELGVQVDVELVEPENVQQAVLRPRAYDVLVYELAIGSDPDIYAYWHSSQKSQNGLNFSNYDSAIPDDALESARAVVDRNLRDEKYRTFVERWMQDAPAVPLYRGTLHYAMANNVRALPEDAEIIDAVDRYRAVEYWTVERGRLYMTP